jgi:hypothetical protein
MSTAAINKALGGVTTVGGAISGLPLPASVKDSLNDLFGTGKTVPPDRNRRDLSNFISNINALDGVQRTAYFYVEIPMPKVFGNKIQSQTLSLLCDSTSLPGVSLATSEIRRYGFGALEKKPYAPVFVDVSMSFICDAYGAIPNIFYQWMRRIVNFSSLPQEGSISTATAKQLNPFEVNYKTDYSVDIFIVTVNDQNDEITTVVLNEAYPIFIGDMSLSWADTDQIARLPVTFTYYNWKMLRFNIKQEINAPSQGFLQTLLKAGTAIQTLASIKRPRGIADAVNASSNLGKVISF